MAEGKKSFVFYADYLNVFEQLSDREAGLLIKHILRYVNDQSPDKKNRIVNMSFEPIKQQLKRDLKEWEAKRSNHSEAGKKGGIKSGESRRLRSKRSPDSKNEANEAVNVTATVNVTDTVSESTGHTHTHEKNKESWNTKPGHEVLTLPLPSIKAGAVTELFGISKRISISSKQIEGLWNVFKSQNFTGEKYYGSANEVYKHFINWCRNQNVMADEVQKVNGSSDGLTAKERHGLSIIN